MADEQPPAPRKVVRRVVKKAAPAPTMRYGRPVDPTDVPTPPVAPSAEPRVRGRRRSVVPAPASEPTPPSGTATAVEDRVETVPEVEPPEPRRQRPRVDVGAAVRRAGSGAGRVVGSGRRRVGATARSIRAWRLPIIDPVPASLITGALVGVTAVLLGRGALEVFSIVRGVASGGGTWGSLTFVVVGFIAFAAGELLLGGFGVQQPRLTSFFGVVLTVIAMLGLFLEQSDTIAAFYLVPAVAATAFAIGHWLMVAAESDPGPS